MTISKEVYIRYYKQQQQGGSLPVYRGGRRDQEGAGLGDIFRGIFRFLAPVALRGISSFASNTLRAHQQGVPLGDAAKAALIPALGDAARSAVGAPQVGGKRRRAARKRANASSTVGGGAGAAQPPAKRRKRAPRSKKRQAGAGNRRRTVKKRGQIGGKKRVYKKKQRGAGKAKKRGSAAKQRGGRKRGTKACTSTAFHF